MIFPWKLVILIAIMAAVGIYYFHYGRELASPQKELLFVRLSLLVVFGFLFVGFFTEPHFAYYVDTSPTHIQTVDDARLAIQRSNEVIEKMANDMRDSSNMAGMILMVLVVLTLSSFLRVSEVLSGEKKGTTGRQ
ncbi:MAG: hypothetical protein HOP17_01535 [Acidobacteria bacterium]|nr:hypothetical protein [Acidobacteriota bacterium]